MRGKFIFLISVLCKYIKIDNTGLVSRRLNMAKAKKKRTKNKHHVKRIKRKKKMIKAKSGRRKRK
jgi:hypothetical protein